MQRMLISVDRDESRAAVVDGGRLTHLEIEPINHDSVKGNIYRAVVARVEPSLQSAFIDFGRPKQGFLPVGEIHRHLRKEGQDKRTPIQEILKAGQELLVQVVRDEIGNKGATLSTYISLPGRYLVLMPQSDKSGVSRKLSDAARQRVRELTESMNVPEGFGLIVRTSGETATKMQLTRDLVYLNRLWKHIEKEFETGKGAAPMYIERSLPIRFVRDYFTKHIDELVIDDENTANEVGAYLKLLMPRTLKAVERYSGAMPLFARYGILAQVESVFSRQVPLPGGGSIVIDQTEALVAIDVNSGRVKGKDIEETARATNLEAAEMIARQLVLRDLGGLVVCDFIDMRDRKAVRDVEAALKSAMKKDKARHKLGRISEFGLLELSRQRLKSAVHRSAFESCAHCSGTGKYRTVESLTSSIIRRVYELITQRPVRYVIAMVPPDAANFLLNQRRRELAAVETEYGIGIEVVPMEGMTPANVMLEHFEEVPARKGADKLRENRIRRVTQHLDLVRNRVIKREDQDIERRIRESKAAAMIDWNAVYSDVEEQTADVEDAPPPGRAKKGKGRGRGKGHKDEKTEERAEASAPKPAPTPAPPPVVEPDYPPLPDAKPGFTGWLKSIFGLGEKPRPAPQVASIVAAPQLPPAQPTAEPAAPAPVEVREDVAEDGNDDEEPRRRRRRRRGRGRRGRDRDEDQSAAADDAPAAEKAEKTDDSDDDDKPRRRRRRRRRRRDDVDGAENGDATEKAAQAEDSASPRDGDDRAGAAESAATEAQGAAASSASDPADRTDPSAEQGESTAVEAVQAKGAAGNDAQADADPMTDVTALAKEEVARLREVAGEPPLPDGVDALGDATTTDDEAPAAAEAADDAAPEVQASASAPSNGAAAPEQANDEEADETADETADEQQAAGIPPALPGADASDDVGTPPELPTSKPASPFVVDLRSPQR